MQKYEPSNFANEKFTGSKNQCDCRCSFTNTGSFLFSDEKIMKKWGWRSETSYITYRPYEDNFICRNDQSELRIHSLSLCKWKTARHSWPCLSELHSVLFSLAKLVRTQTSTIAGASSLSPHVNNFESTNWEFPEHSSEVSLNSQRSNSSKMCRTKVYHIKRHSQ